MRILSRLSLAFVLGFGLLPHAVSAADALDQRIHDLELQYANDTKLMDFYNQLAAPYESGKYFALPANLAFDRPTAQDVLPATEDIVAATMARDVFTGKLHQDAVPAAVARVKQFTRDYLEELHNTEHQVRLERQQIKDRLDGLYFDRQQRQNPVVVSQAAPVLNLSGTWTADSGGAYNVTQTVGGIQWDGTSPDGGKAWAHHFSGTINGNQIDGSFKDYDSGGARNQGPLTFKIIDNNHFQRTSPSVFADRNFSRVGN